VSDPFEPFLALWGLAPDGRPEGAKDVMFVRRGDERLVLKRLVAGDELRMAKVLTHWAGVGAVRCVAAAKGALLMERALPGRQLLELFHAGREDEATGVFCDILSALRRPPPQGAFRTVEDWGEGFERVREAGLAAGVEATLIDAARALFAELCASQGPRILLHGDLHHYNIVEDARRGWLAIDPKGVLGEAAYDTGAWLRNPLDVVHDPAAIERRAAIIAGRLGLPRDRILGWHFSQCVLSCLWGVEDGDFDPAWLGRARVARTLV